MPILKKKATVKRLTEYLERHGWSGYQELEEPNEEEGMILTGWRNQRGASYVLVVDPMIEKNAVLLSVRNVATAPPDSTPADRLNAMLLAMTGLNNQMIFGSWGFDPSDGEVVFRTAIPIASGDLAFEDFEHCLRTVTATVDRYAPELRSIVEGESTAAQILS